MALIPFLMLAAQTRSEESAAREAVAKALAALRADPSARGDLVLLTLMRAGRSENGELVYALRDKALARMPATTSAASYQAQAMQAFHGPDARQALRVCAQFFADNQAVDGLWGEGAPIDPVTSVALPRPDVWKLARDGDPTVPHPRFKVQARRSGPPTGDAVNTRLAVEGLLACRLGGAEFDPAMLDRAAAGWTTVERDPSATVAVLSILRKLQKRDGREDPDVLKAVRRLSTVRASADGRALYERREALLLHDGVILSGAAWIPEGRRLLVEGQQPDGRWDDLETTCYALLFLQGQGGAVKPWPAPLRK
jgi:hypothetical protein